MANLAAAYWGHDSSICFYNDQSKTFHVIEIEKLTGIKHYRGHARYEEQKEILERCLKVSEEDFGIENDYDVFIVGSDIHEQINPLCLDPDIVKQVFNVRETTTHHRHHAAHAWGAYAQSPWVTKRCTVFTHDAGGDDGHTHIWRADSKRLLSLDKVNYDRTTYGYIDTRFFGRNYNISSGLGCQNMVGVTPNPLDMAGKVMGASAYGDHMSYFGHCGKGLLNEDEEITEAINPSFPWFRRQYMKSEQGLVRDNIMRYGRTFSSGKEWWVDNQADSPEEHNYFQMFISPLQLTWEEECDVAAGIQRQHEDNVLEYLQTPRVWDEIVRNGKRLVISGGCGLNILTNTRIQDELGLEVFVPPDVNDSGLPFGMLCKYMAVNGMSEFEGVDIRYAGQPIQDMELLDVHKSTIITLEQLADLLKDDKILGLVQGTSEVGPRALGNRSIICDPKGWDKKDKVNIVKCRENYRPFAPMVRQEDAHIYFEATSYDNLEYMNFSVKTREEYKEELAAVTHVDGTARVQSVTRKSNALVYDLLSACGGVLLNTSFNVRGKPILNTLKEAFEVLEETALDGVVVYHDEKLHYFTSELL